MMTKKSYTLPKIIAIVGPTASGKTNLATKLARKFGGEIVSADSRQIYRGMNIGTAKYPNSKIKNQKSKILLIDIRNPNQSYTLAQYKEDAVKAIRQIIKKGKLPFLVGGTGLYVSAVLDNLEIPKVKPDRTLRARLERSIAKRGLAFAFKKLIRLDPEAAYIVDPKNPRRIIRALEVALATGQPFTEQRKKGPKIFDALILGLNPGKAKLKKTIARRTILMMKHGLVQEVKKLLKAYGLKLTAYDSIGYREIIEYLQGRITPHESVNLINQNTWRFARRQMNWFRRMPVVWIKNQREAEKEIRKFISIFPSS